MISMGGVNSVSFLLLSLNNIALLSLYFREEGIFKPRVLFISPVSIKTITNYLEYMFDKESESEKRKRGRTEMPRNAFNPI